MGEIMKLSVQSMGAQESLALLKENLLLATQTPVVDEVVSLVGKQLDGVAFSLLSNRAYLIDCIRRWEDSSTFRTRHKTVEILKSQPFITFHVEIKNHLEDRNAKEERVPFNGETNRTSPTTDMEQLNARFPLHPFESTPTEWIRLGSEHQSVCVKCEGNRKFTCESCGGEGHTMVRCPQCRGSGVMDKGRTMVGTDVNAAVKNFGKPGGHIPVNVNRYTEQIQCEKCVGMREIQEKCNICSGKGEIVCSGCKGRGKQYAQQRIVTKVSFSEVDKVIPKEVSAKWVNAVKASEKVIIQDYLPGDVSDKARECRVVLQSIGITVIPSVAVLARLDGQNAEMVILNNRVFMKNGPPEYRAALIILPIVAGLLLLVAAILGMQKYLSGNSTKTKAAPQVSIPAAVQQPVDTPAQELETTKAIKKKIPKRKAAAGEPDVVEIPNAVPPSPPAEDMLDQYLKKPAEGTGEGTNTSGVAKPPPK
jgi:hypothetical protein